MSTHTSWSSHQGRRDHRRPHPFPLPLLPPAPCPRRTRRRRVAPIGISRTQHTTCPKKPRKAQAECSLPSSTCSHEPPFPIKAQRLPRGVSQNPKPMSERLPLTLRKSQAKKLIYTEAIRSHHPFNHPPARNPLSSLHSQDKPTRLE